MKPRYVGIPQYSHALWLLFRNMRTLGVGYDKCLDCHGTNGHCCDIVWHLLRADRFVMVGLRLVGVAWIESALTSWSNELVIIWPLMVMILRTPQLPNNVLELEHVVCDGLLRREIRSLLISLNFTVSSPPLPPLIVVVHVLSYNNVQHGPKEHRSEVIRRV